MTDRPKVLVFTLGWKLAQDTLAARQLSPELKRVPFYAHAAKWDRKCTLFKRVKEKKLPAAKVKAVWKVIDEITRPLQRRYFGQVSGGGNPYMTMGTHDSASVEEVVAAFEADGFEVVRPDRRGGAASVAPAKKQGKAGAPAALAARLKRVSKGALADRPVPDALRALWAAQLAGTSPFAETDLGEVTLFETLPKRVAAAYLGAKVVGREAYRKLFDEVRFFGSEANGGLLGFWLWDPKVKLEDAPIVRLDSEGGVRVTGRDLLAHFEATARGTEAGLVRPVRAWFTEHAPARARDKRRPPSLPARFDRWYAEATSG